MALLSSKIPSFLILCSFVFLSLVFATQQCNHHHFSALLQLKQGFDFSYTNRNLSSWNSNDPNCCSWEGITCHGATGYVISLDLGGLWMNGRIDFESVFRLRNLQRLNLAQNNFDPTPIPSEIDQLISLTHLNLSHSSFYGQIPPEIFHLTALVSLDLSYNEYANTSVSLSLKLENPSIGALVQNLPSLSELYLDWVDILALGSESVQPLFLPLPRLNKLSLRNCGLSGSIYSFLSQLHFLSELDLSYNNLSSAVPNFTGTLRKLILQACGLSSSIFSSLSQLHFLSELDLSYNNLASAVDSLPNLKFLTHLYLPQCNLSGSLPSSLSNLTKLQYLALSSNRLSGPIPSSYGNELLNLKVIDLWNNSLNGTIPSSLFSLPSLQKLNLRANQLSGELGEFHNASSSQLEIIYLNNNNLQGIIPRSVFQLRKLKELDVSFNKFSGVVELGLFQNLKNLLLIDLSENKLSVQDVGGNFTFVSFPQFEYLGLRSCNINAFPNFLRNQELLRGLDLSNNKISGEIPKWIWEVGNGALFSLNLSHNVLQGVLPPSPHLLPNPLTILDLSSNMLEGSLPIPSPSILFFSVSNNSLGGEIPLSFCNAIGLTVLDLSYNHFIGQVPPCLGEIGNALIVLNLQGNAFNGTLLQTFKEGCNIQTLDLSQNQFEGQVPRSLANCKMLEVLNLGNNQINDTFPSWIEVLPQLCVLVLKFNKFYGTIGHPLINHPSPLLQIFDLSSNSFEGNLPSNMFKSWKGMMRENKFQTLYLGKPIIGSVYYQDKVSIVSKGLQFELVKILTAFTVVDLSKNKFEGEIPKSFGDLKSLHVLNISYNHFMGSIPTSFGSIKELESLDLSQNELSGEIPQQLTELTFLAVLNLSQNHLMGKIPQSRQFLTFNNESFKGNLGLCGLPLSRKCKDNKGTTPSALSPLESEKNYDWELLWIGFGVGYGVGVGMLFWTLALWRKGRREFYIFFDKILFLIFPSIGL
ncbi:receptor like protein 22-like [Magnolia sinica]|uniref:receptor like protein 22-like n=1 Tax=Magnolia sinica TaxID=86752 RepID=UPI00265821B4|nr:receptor like protein 22-like [Magnolia sinica]